jgi:hypothetical protein
VNGDGVIDQGDINAIFQVTGSPASGFADPRDPDQDGQITVADARICVTRCTFTNCATDPPFRGGGGKCGLLGVEALAALGLVELVRWVRGYQRKTSRTKERSCGED